MSDIFDDVDALTQHQLERIRRSSWRRSRKRPWTRGHIQFVGTRA